MRDVTLYKASLRAGWHPAQRLPEFGPITGQFFRTPSQVDSTFAAPSAWQSSVRYFGWYDVPGPGAPDWFRNPFTGARPAVTDAPWHRYADFDATVGDIKAIWEASRFEWVMALAQQARAGDAHAVSRLNGWMTDWCTQNPPYRGPNWMCGQEASIRVMHLAIASVILGAAATMSRPLLILVRAHMSRIAPTMSYARAQNNNHGTSEAAALFVGGSWLAAADEAGGSRLAETGRAALEERGQALIAPDGTFSQYSVVYHRLMLDTFIVAEIWRRQLNLPPFSAQLRRRLAAATEWLASMTDPKTGDAPNLGHNDGANLLPLTDAAVRDFRPTVHTAAALFLERAAYPDAGSWHDQLRWLDVAPCSRETDAPSSRRFDDGGVAVLRRGSATALLRYPRHRFRPGHADAMHLDLSVDGVNLLRDGGTYSYADADAMAYYPTVAAHNTVQFDNHDQMPRIGRFLYGDWVQTERASTVSDDGTATRMTASYRDAYGARQSRSVALRASTMDVVDDVSGFASRAVLRWRLMPGPWRLDGHVATDGRHAIAVSATTPLKRLEFVTGRESREYLQQSDIPVLEAEIAEAGSFTTEVRWP